LCAQFVNKILKKSDLGGFIFIFNRIINNLNLFRWGTFAQKKNGGGGVCSTTKLASHKPQNVQNVLNITFKKL
jgi:hypothetical protein